MKNKVGIIGLGNLGSAVAHLIANNGFDVIAWEHQVEVVNEVNNKNRNSTFLAGIELPKNIIATNDLSLLLSQVELVFITLPSRFIRPVLQPAIALMPANIAIVNLAKGIDAASGMTAYQIIDDIFPLNPKAVISGPSLANEFVRGVATAVIAASENHDLLRQVRQLMGNQNFKVAFSSDRRGVELGGILKNIYALGYGILVNNPDTSLNFSGVYFTLALKEMARLGAGLGAQKDTFFELSGIGDLVCTALSPNSHNRKLGELFSQGLSIKQAEIKMGLLPESYNALKTLLPIAKEKNIDVPIAQNLMDGLDGLLSIDDFYQKIMAEVQSQ